MAASSFTGTVSYEYVVCFPILKEKLNISEKYVLIRSKFNKIKELEDEIEQLMNIPAAECSV